MQQEFPAGNHGAVCHRLHRGWAGNVQPRRVRVLAVLVGSFAAVRTTVFQTDFGEVDEADDRAVPADVVTDANLNVS